jgi:hypothetical protein
MIPIALPVAETKTVSYEDIRKLRDILLSRKHEPETLLNFSKKKS